MKKNKSARLRGEEAARPESDSPRNNEGGKTFLGRLRELVEGRQKAVAETIGRDQQVVSAWVRGGKCPAEMAAKIADACGVSVEWLITGREPATRPLRADLLAQAIEQVEEEAGRMNYRMTRARAALVIAQTYGDLLNEGQINRKKLISLLRAA